MLTKVESTRRGSGDGQVIGGLLVVVGVGWLLHRAGVADIGWRTVLSAMLVALGVGLVLTARRSGGFLLVVFGVLLTVVLAVSSATPKFDFRRNRHFAGVGDVTRNEVLVPETGLSVERAAGDVELNLRNLATYTGTRHVKVRVKVGDITIYVPSTVKVSVSAHVGLGDVKVLDRPQQDGIEVDDSFTDEGFDGATQKLVIDANVITGEIHVIRAEPE